MPSLAAPPLKGRGNLIATTLSIRRRLTKFGDDIRRLSRVLLMRQMPEIRHFRRLAHPPS